MLRVEATLGSGKENPFSITGADVGRVIPKARTYHDGSVRDAVARELNLSGYQLVAGCACLLGAAKLLLWALLRLWLFEP
jgi:hypothetical protein